MGHPAVFVAVLIGQLLVTAGLRVVVRRRVSAGLLPPERELVLVGAGTAIAGGAALLAVVVGATLLDATPNGFALWGAAIALALTALAWWVPSVATVVGAVLVLPLMFGCLLTITDIDASPFDGAYFESTVENLAIVAAVALVLGVLGRRRPFASGLLLLTFATPLALAAVGELIGEVTPPRWLVLLADSVPLIVAAVLLLVGNAALRKVRGPEATGRARRRVLIGGILLGTLAAGTAIYGFVAWQWNRERPPTPRPTMAEHPEPSLRGTVAYLRVAPHGRACLEVVAAAGTPARRLDCIPYDYTRFPNARLTWLPDGRLELRSDLYLGSDQRIYDLGTGAVEVHPDAGVLPDDEHPLEPRPTTSRGRKLDIRPANGHVIVTITENGRRRTLLDDTTGGTHRADDYEVAWSPDGNYVMVYDEWRRLLIITPRDGKVRVLGNRLVDRYSSNWTLTPEDLLAPD